MRKIKFELSNFFWDFKFNDAVIGIFSLLIIYSSFIYDPSYLPKGWELPKAYFIQISFLILTVCSIFFIFMQIHNNNDKLFNQFKWPLCITFTILLTGTFSHYGRLFSLNEERNPIYQSILKLIGASGTTKLPMNFFGNEYRDQGLLFFILLIWGLSFIYSMLSKKNYKLILNALVITGIIQAGFAVSQFINLYKNHRALVDDGIWVFGRFGQAEFYSGTILAAILASTYLLFLANKNYVKIVYTIITAYLLCAIFISYSYWSFVSLAFFTLFLGSLLALKKQWFIKLVPFQFLSFIFITPLGINIYSNSNPQYEHRLNIWENILKVYTSKFDFLLFGSGFDTLGEVFYERRILYPNYIDRAHNIFLDIFISVGIIGSLVLISLFVLALIKHSKNINKTSNLLLIIVFTLLLRSEVNTSSVFNIVVLLTIITIYLKSLTFKISNSN